MKFSQPSFSMLSLLMISLLLPWNSVYAARVVDGSLGAWIEQDVSPMLSKLLTNHPRFKGEPIKIMAMSGGFPVVVNNKLTNQIREQLTEDLLSGAEVKIVFDDNNRCRPVKVNTILGIEVQKHTSGKHRVSLAMVDIEEGIWLNGTNISWNGKLTSSQRRAFKAGVERRVAASILASYETSEIAEALYSQLQCNETIISPVFFEPVVDDSGQAVLRHLREKFSSSVLTTIDKNTAASIISLRLPAFYSEGDDLRRQSPVTGSYILGLANIDDPLRVHRIAEVRVSHRGSAGTKISTHQAVYPNTQYPAAPGILSEIHIAEGHSRDNVCEPRKKDCVDVSFDVNQPAYTVLFYSVNGQAAPLSCKPPGRKQTGKQYYGLNVPAGLDPNRPTVGFYALAFKDRAAARQVHSVISNNNSICGGRKQSTSTWMASLTRLLDRYGDKYRDRTDWQAIHLTRYHAQITEL